MRTSTKLVLPLFGGGTLPFIYDETVDFSTLTSLPTGWLGAHWDVVAGKTRNSPTLGANLLTNGDFEASATTGWTLQGTPTNSQVADPRTGSAGSQAANVVRGTNTLSMTQNYARTVGDWVLLDAWIKNVDDTTGCNMQIQAGTGYGGNALGTYWATASWLHVGISWPMSVSGGSANISTVAPTTGKAARFDDIAAYHLTTADLFLVKQQASQYGTVSAVWDSALLGANGNGYPVMGVVMCADYPTFNNFVLVWLDGDGYLHMDKRVAGTYTRNVIAAVNVQKLVAGYSIMLRRMPDTNLFQMFYGPEGAEVQRGGNATIADATIISNTYHGLFDTGYQVNSCSKISYVAPSYGVGFWGAKSLTANGAAAWHGNYRVSNNDWGRVNASGGADTHSIQLSSSRDADNIKMDAVWSTVIGNGGVKAYPEIIYGYPVGFLGGTTTPNLPMLISSLPALTANFDTSVVWGDGAASGDVTFDIWTTTNNPPTSAQRTNEIMILTNYQHPWFNTVSPNLGFVVIDGYTWAVNRSGPTALLYLTTFAVVAPDFPINAGTLHLNTFFAWMVAGGYLALTDYLAAIEFGSEPVSGSATVAINQYSVL